MERVPGALRTRGHRAGPRRRCPPDRRPDDPQPYMVARICEVLALPATESSTSAPAQDTRRPCWAGRGAHDRTGAGARRGTPAGAPARRQSSNAPGVHVAAILGPPEHALYDRSPGRRRRREARSSLYAQPEPAGGSSYRSGVVAGTGFGSSSAAPGADRLRPGRFHREAQFSTFAGAEASTRGMTGAGSLRSTVARRPQRASRPRAAGPARPRELDRAAQVLVVGRAGTSSTSSSTWCC